jgi:DNA-binding transcriptional regulator GbsR (MarR family)
VKICPKQWRFHCKRVLSGDEISFPKRELGQKNYDNMSVTLGDKRPSYSTVKNYVAMFRTGHFSTEDKRSGRPTQVTVPENVDAIYSMILDNRRITAKKIAETLVISQERVGYIIHEILDMKNISAKCVPKCLNSDQKHDRVLASQAILDGFWQDPVEFFNHLVTMDETWIHIRI